MNADWRDDKQAVIGVLQEQNPSASSQLLAMYADAFGDYRAAQKNIDEHGVIVVHPRTGSPIDNPYLKVRESARKALLELKGKGLPRVDVLWAEETTPAANSVKTPRRKARR